MAEKPKPQPGPGRTGRAAGDAGHARRGRGRARRRAVSPARPGRVPRRRLRGGRHRPVRPAAQPGGFPYYGVGLGAAKDETNYELRIDGLVERPRTYTLGELRALPQTWVVHDVLCTDGCAWTTRPSGGAVTAARTRRTVE
ncbi:molybdopterin-dependent oxidoreductase [Streptomyces sp. NPDC052015]|uniref:molybdopterin-dependent oxidoreductase n=1 Tax=Streptomyces sp. NPDC052015 TaxID=3154755 RepID=UPI003443AE0B